MFFNSVAEVQTIASKCGTAVFVIPKNIAVEIKNAIYLKPENRSVITIEQVRQILVKLGVKQTSDVYVAIRPAEQLSLESANALLKNLEEPGKNVHFVLITDEPSQILPTVMSRAAIYFLRDHSKIDGTIDANARVKELAKRLMVAKGEEVVSVAEEITKKKDGVRGFALEVVDVAIEMLYKTYFLTNKTIFLKKLPKFLKIYENIARNGHVKLQIIANLC